MVSLGPPTKNTVTPWSSGPAGCDPILCVTLAPVFQMCTESSCLGPSPAICPRRSGGRLVSGSGGEGAGGLGPRPSCPLCKELLSGGVLSWAPGSGQSSQGFTDGAPRGVTVHVVSRVSRLLGNSTMLRRTSRASGPACTCMCIDTHTHEGGT